ncbi:hypothetical protein AB4Z18_10220 [Leifsonia sp. 2TAF2]|uniref:hypothetical protein n=1 Tax=Leifsonia sp. 2TAF2 TaxID=3233009 RepID=UPI003F985006
MTAPAEPRTRASATDRWLLVASVVVSGMAVFAQLALIGAVGLLVWVSVRLAGQRPRSVALLTTSIIVLSLSIVIALAIGIATATVSDPGTGHVTLTPGG